jgi:3-oxoacyl-[acyl-carrier protein] reductase/7-alpha-hydroxysteroid dehydrogenase
MEKLENKVVLVTGASKGIGAQIAKNMAKEGAKVIVNFNTDRIGAEKVVSDILDKGGLALPIQADVSKRAGIQNLFKTIHEKFGKITTLVNNAGIYKFEPIAQVTESEFHNHFTTNVLSVFMLTQEAILQFDENGGNIINISSVATVKPTPMTSLYTATKGAVDGLTTVLAQELGAQNIRVNSILPGPTETEGNEITDEFKSFITQNTPLGRIGKKSDVAQMATFLASDNASFITGQKICVSGGFE